MSASRELLFGLLALQNDLIDRAGLVRAFDCWAVDKKKSLADYLVEQNALSAEERDLMHALVGHFIVRHCGDVDRSLAALSASDSVQRDLQRLNDADLQGSLASVRVQPASEPNNVERDPLKTIKTFESGEIDRTRFRLVRPHAEGGLGRVFVARDLELNREVALKRIKEEHADNADSRSRFQFEAEITGRLEHPGIVPVYGLGTYSNGRPFYAMRFIKGNSLKEEIEAFHVARGASQVAVVTQGNASPTQQGVTFRKLLQRFIDVCEAVHYAHSRGILHRDLKPGNVMVGRYGETLVVDWGLAKAIGKNSELPLPESTLAPRAGSGGAPTVVGTAVGTPAFMSPEQAAGRLDELGVASDVYSLGATLYVLVTGRAPYDAAEASCLADLLRKVQKGDFRHPREVSDFVPGALDAICGKAMAARPSDRYASAKELSDDIEKYLADERVQVYVEPVLARVQRSMRRHPGTSAAAAATLLVGLVGLTVGLYFVSAEQRNTKRALHDKSEALIVADQERTKALKSSALAAARLEEKRSALDQMLEAFSDDGLKARPGSQAVREQFLQRGLDQYRQLLEEHSGDESVVLQIARALSELAQVQMELGRGDDALKSYLSAVGALQAALTSESASVPMRLALVNATCDVADCLTLQNRTGEIDNVLTGAVDVCASLRAEYPARTEVKVCEARMLNSRNIHRALPSAVEDANKAISLLTEAVSEVPDSPEYLSQLGRMIANRANGRGDTIPVEETVQELRKAIQLQTQAVALSPSMVAAHRRRMYHATSLVAILRRGQKPNEALEQLESIMTVMQEFVEKNPLVVVARVALGDAFHEKAVLLETTGRHDDALAAYAASVAQAETCMQLVPADAQHLSNKIVASGAAYDLTVRHNLPLAVDALSALADSSDQYVADFPHNSAVARQLQQVCAAVGRHAHQREQYDAAGARHLQSFALGEQDLVLKNELGTITAARCAAASWNAAKLYERAIDIADRGMLCGEESRSREYGMERVNVRAERAAALSALGRARDALVEWQGVRDAASAAIDTNPRDVAAHLVLARSLRGLAHESRAERDAEQEHSALLAYLTHEKYFDGLDHGEPSAEPSGKSERGLPELRALVDSPREAFEAVIPVQRAGEDVAVTITLFRSFQPVQDQLEMLKQSSDFIVDGTLDALRRIYDSAPSARMSAPALFLYATSSSKPSLNVIRALEAHVASLRSQSSDPAAVTRTVDRVVRGYISLARCYQTADPERGSKYLRLAREFLESAEEADESGKLFLRAVLTREAALLLARHGAAEDVKHALIKAVDSHDGDHHASDGAVEKALADVCKLRHQDLEAMCWYWRAVECGNSDALLGLCRVYAANPAHAAAVPLDVATLLREAADSMPSGRRLVHLRDRFEELWTGQLRESAHMMDSAVLIRRARSLSLSNRRALLEETANRFQSRELRIAFADACVSASDQAEDTLRALEVAASMGRNDAEGTRVLLHYLEALLTTDRSAQFEELVAQLENEHWQPQGTPAEVSAATRVYLSLKVLADVSKSNSINTDEIDERLRSHVHTEEPLVVWEWERVVSWIADRPSEDERRRLLSALVSICDVFPERVSPTDNRQVRESTEVNDVLVRILALVSGEDEHGRSKWALVALRPSRAAVFKDESAQATVRLSEYGEVLVYRNGAGPLPDEMEYLSVVYAADPAFQQRLKDTIDAVVAEETVTNTDAERQRGARLAALRRGHSCVRAGDFAGAVAALAPALNASSNGFGHHCLWLAHKSLGHEEVGSPGTELEFAL